MKHYPAPLASVALAASLGMPCAEVQAATAALTWVASTGKDTNACTRAAPCATFAGALAKTSPSGAIACVDSGSFGPVVINKALKIDCAAVQAEISAPSGVGITVAAAAADGVLINGVSIQGVLTGTAGVKVTSGGNVGVFNSRIEGFKTGTGVLVAPSAASVNLKMQNDIIVKNGTGVYVNSTAAGAGKVIAVGVDNSVVNGNTSFGVRLTSTNAFTGITADTTKIEANAGTGVSVEGAYSGIVLRNSNVAVNGTGITSSGGGSVLSTGNNLINSNVSAGVTPTIISQE